MGIRDSRESYNAYMRRYHLKRYYRLRKMAIEYLGGKCAQCDNKTNLELDHKDKETKEIEVSRMLNVSLKAFWAEVKKCQLLCDECHSVKTILESGKKVAKGTHGTLSAYRYCKCPLCRAVKSEHNREYRLRRSVS